MATTGDSTGLILDAAGKVEGRSLWADARQRLFRNKAAVVSMVILLVIALLAVFAPWLSPHAYDEICSGLGEAESVLPRRVERAGVMMMFHHRHSQARFP